MCQVFCGKSGLVDHCVDLGGERVEGVAEGGVAIDRRRAERRPGRDAGGDCRFG